MYALRCYSCNREYDINKPIWRCECGGFLDIVSDEKVDLSLVDKTINGFWRYKKFIPVFSEEAIVSFNESFTPLVRDKVFGKDVFLKLDYLFPSGSYKDRGSSVLVSKVKELGISKVLEDSSGNAGSSIAMYCAKANVEANIFVPSSTSKGKLTQLVAFGANLKLVKGDRQATSEAAINTAERMYYASHVYNPFFFEGTKTFIFELFEQMNFKLPDNIVMPVGNGTLLIGAYIACKQLMESGYIDKFPKFVCVQSDNCSPLSYVLYGKEKKYSTTMAEGIAIRNPLRLDQMCEIIKETKGIVVTVLEEDIKEGLLEMVRKGYYIEPTSASAIAALKVVDLTGSTLVELTGNGLKANEKIYSLLK